MVNSDYIEFVKAGSLPKVNLTKEEKAACESVAEAVHDEWARGKIQSGVLDHQDLDFYKHLSREVQLYDVRSARATLSVLKHLGWELIPPTPKRYNLPSSR